MKRGSESAKTLLALVCVFAAASVAHSSSSVRSSFQRQELGGTSWTLSNSNGSIASKATVPGNVYTDLLENGVIEGDPYYRDNEAYFQWVAFDDWTYATTFDLDDGIDAYDSIQLQCDGIDTVSYITLNGASVGATHNMHLRFVFEVASLLRLTGNELVITISSPIKQGLQASEAYPYPVPSNDGPRYLPYRNFVRKAQSDFGVSVELRPEHAQWHTAEVRPGPAAAFESGR